jgi:hypothetical protein
LITCLDAVNPEDKVVSNVHTKDVDDGTYVCSYTAPKAGKYSIDVYFEGTFDGQPGPVRGSPFQATFEDGQPQDSNTMEGAGMMKFIRASTTQLKDQCQNTLRGLKKKLTDDLEGVLKCKEVLFKVEEESAATQLLVDTVSTTLAYLKDHNGHVDREIKQIKEAGFENMKIMSNKAQLSILLSSSLPLRPM